MAPGACHFREPPGSCELPRSAGRLLPVSQRVQAIPGYAPAATAGGQRTGSVNDAKALAWPDVVHASARWWSGLLCWSGQGAAGWPDHCALFGTNQVWKLAPPLTGRAARRPHRCRKAGRSAWRGSTTTTTASRCGPCSWSAPPPGRRPPSPTSRAACTSRTSPTASCRTRSPPWPG